MFAQARPTSKRSVTSLAISIALHCLILYLLVLPPKPLLVTPSSLMHGNYGKSMELISAAKAGIEYPRPEQRTILTKPAKKRPRIPRSEAEAVQAPRAGTPFGTLLEGPVTGHDIRPALPMVFPDPTVGRSELPAGAEATVIIEITIDDKGNVVGMKVLKPSGLGVEERVLAVLRNWRFRPATRDGVAIASQQDVYFHFPTKG